MPDQRLVLTRVQRPRQTLGILRLYEGARCAMRCVTSELPWQQNERRESCIPPAPGESRVFTAQPHTSPRYGRTLWVRQVPGRSEILVHAGNYVSDTLGCILVGRQYADIDGDGLTDITHSRDTLAELMDRIGGPVPLAIRWSTMRAAPAGVTA